MLIAPMFTDDADFPAEIISSSRPAAAVEGDVIPLTVLVDFDPGFTDDLPRRFKVAPEVASQLARS